MKSVAFDSIRLLQPTFDRKGTTRMMSFGDLAPEIETFIFDMRPAEVAAPIEILNGYMVIQLVDGVVDKFLSEMDLAQQKSRLKKIIFERKAGPLANRYVKKLMLEKNLTLNPEAFFALSKLFSQLAETASPEPALVPVNLTDSELRAVDQNAQSLRESILASYEGGQLTVGEFLDKLQNMPAGLRPRVKMDRQVKDAIGVMVRNQFLAAEARQAGLHELPGVRNEVRIQQDQALAEYYLILEQKRKQIGDREIAAFKQSAEFEELCQRLGDGLSDEKIASIIRDFRMARTKLELSDSLRQRFPVLVDSTRLRALVRNPEEIIDQDPIPFVTREIFN